jgi:RNA polymerase sigma-70 factor, ECF subfamily
MAALRDAFLAALDPEGRAAMKSEEALEAALDRLVVRGRTAWPSLAVDGADFVAQIAGRLSPHTLAALEALHAEDLWLACACGASLPGAIEAFEGAQLSVLQGILERFGAPAEVVAEVQQTMRKALFVQEGDRRPEIQDYSGRGRLRAWIRVTAIRHATRALQKRRKDVALGDGALIDALCPGEDPAVAFVKQVHRADLAQALGAALEALSPRERNLLRQHLLDGLSTEQLGALHGVHRTTVFRWIERIRASVLSRTRKALIRRFQIDREEAESLMRLVQSQVDVSLERILAPK